MDLAQGRGLVAREEPFTRFDVYTADKCFLTGTACEMRPMMTCVGRQIGTTRRMGPITAQVVADDRELARTPGTPITSWTDRGMA